VESAEKSAAQVHAGRVIIWLVPFVNDGKELFLKTLYPSRKYTKVYREKERKNETD
jgi:hypothetical protein